MTGVQILQKMEQVKMENGKFRIGQCKTQTADRRLGVNVNAG